MRQVWKMERQLARLSPDRPTSCWCRAPGRDCNPGRLGRCVCGFATCLEAWWAVYKWSDANPPWWSQPVFPKFYQTAHKNKLKDSVNNPPVRATWRKAIDTRQTVSGALHLPREPTLSHNEWPLPPEQDETPPQPFSGWIPLLVAVYSYTHWTFLTQEEKRRRKSVYSSPEF